MAVCLFFAVWLFPVSSTATRAAGVASFATIWLGLCGLIWRQRALRYGWLVITVLLLGLAAWPNSRRQEPLALRGEYLQALQRYEGVTYYWGGESPKGIDCSGLVRRGLIDAIALQGLKHFDAGLVRESVRIWWRDCTAEELGKAQNGLTKPVQQVSSLNAADESALQPGDLAVTRSGIHVLAYLGDRTWIEADPEKGKVIRLQAPDPQNHWLDAPMNIVRWSIFSAN